MTILEREEEAHLRTIGQLKVLRDLVQTLIDNDPNETIADNGMTVLDAWRERARAAITAGEWGT